MLGISVIGLSKRCNCGVGVGYIIKHLFFEQEADLTLGPILSLF